MSEVTQATETPFYFGADAELYGCLHRAPRPTGRGVVMCYPWGREYNRSHRAFRQLAFRLADRGTSVLRFDYYGTGDSRGAVEEGDVSRWVRDVEAAIEALAERGDASRIALTGLRLGASLAALAARARPERLDGVALWDPVVHGRDYVEELKQTAAEPLWGVDEEPPEETRDAIDASPPDPAQELLGVPMSPTRYLDLEAVDLTTLPAPAERGLVLETGPAVGADALAARWGMAFERLPAAEIWKDDEGALLPRNVLERIAGWLAPEPA